MYVYVLKFVAVYYMCLTAICINSHQWFNHDPRVAWPDFKFPCGTAEWYSSSSSDTLHQTVHSGLR